MYGQCMHEWQVEIYIDGIRTRQYAHAPVFAVTCQSLWHSRAGDI